MTIHPLLKQILGAAAGIAVAYGLYVGVTEWSYLPGQLLEPVVAQTVTTVAPDNEQNERIARIADRAKRALEQAPRRLPPAAYEDVQVTSELNAGAPRKIEQPAPRSAPQGTPRSELTTNLQRTPLTNSGPPLLLLGALALGSAGIRTSLRRRSHVSS